MEDKIKTKIDEVIETILAKDAKDISYSEYCIIKSRYDQLKYEKEQEDRNKKLRDAVIDSFGGFGSIHEKVI